MNYEAKIKDLSTTRWWIKYYLGQQEKLAQEQDIDLLNVFTDELWDFLHGLKSKRLADKRLSSATKTELAEFYRQLRRLAQILALRATELRGNQEIMKRLDSMALPEPTEGTEVRDLSMWNIWPLRYSERLRVKLTTARLPQ